MTPGLAYSHIYVYRGLMNLLYRGRYHGRFMDVVELFGPDIRSVCDLCFGDTALAEWCRTNGVDWTGVDLNSGFCARARRHGFRVLEGDLLSVDLPRADAFVIAGSLYHFHDRLAALFDAIFQRTDRLIVSEPVRNLSTRGGVLSQAAASLVHPGDKPALFRYDAESLVSALREQQARRDFTFRIVSSDRDMLLDISALSAQS